MPEKEVSDLAISPETLWDFFETAIRRSKLDQGDTEQSDFTPPTHDFTPAQRDLSDFTRHDYTPPKMDFGDFTEGSNDSGE